MLTDEFLERVFANKEMQKMPIGCQSTAVHAFQEVFQNKQLIRSNIPQIPILQGFALLF